MGGQITTKRKTRVKDFPQESNGPFALRCAKAVRFLVWSLEASRLMRAGQQPAETKPIYD